MRALILSEQLSFFSEVESPIPSVGEALVAVSQAGICNTDLELTRGYMGFCGIPGHEFVGTLQQVPAGVTDESGKPLVPGCRVVAEINCSPPGGPLDPTGRFTVRDDLRAHLLRRGDATPSGHKLRDFGLGAQVLRELGVKSMRLLTNNPKKIAGLTGHGLHLVESIPLLPKLP